MFKTAKPIWIKNYREMCNLQCGFRCDFKREKSERCVLKICGATVYKIYLNGRFVHYGPARAAHGYLRYDTIEFDAEQGINRLAIEVAGYNCNGYYTLKHESFVIAEMYDEGGNIIAATGKDFNGIMLDKLRERKVFRFTFQRDFSEVWRIDNSSKLTDWKTADNLHYDTVGISPVYEEYIDREVPLPKYEIVDAAADYRIGDFEHKPGVLRYEPDQQNIQVSCELDGYRPDVILDRVAEELYGKYTQSNVKYGADKISVKENQYAICKFSIMETGFLRVRLNCAEDSIVYLIFGEAMSDGMIEFDNEMNGVNAIKYTLKGSDIPYELETFEPYTYKYVGIVVTKGSVVAEGFSVREYCYPYADAVDFWCDNDKLCKVFEAARETFRQNTLDTYMDCPSRERAAWLCDSYFIGFAEHLLTMDTLVEKVFFDNFNMAKEFPCVPKGMVPMCYPADHFRGVYIPQYALWFILQFGDYVKRSGLCNFENYREILYGIMEFFLERRNDEGFLENLESWNFIEWSEANDYMTGVNIPTNMLFSKACGIVSEMFGDAELLRISKELSDRVTEYAYNGEQFFDNLERDENGELKRTKNSSEICQYIAFFTGVADESEKFTALKNELINECGPGRVNKKFVKANAFVGDYIRMHLMKKWMPYKEFRKDIVDGFYNMAVESGTLWEHSQPIASRNHGFASYAGAAIFESVTGIEFIDVLNKKVFINVDREVCENFEVKIKVTDGCIAYSSKEGLSMPTGWELKEIHNGEVMKNEN